MKIFEIGTGYTTMPPTIGAATEIVAYNLYKSFNKLGYKCELVDITFSRSVYKEGVHSIYVPSFLNKIKDNGFYHFARRIFYAIGVARWFSSYHRNNLEDIICLHFHNQFTFFFFFVLNYFILKRGSNKIITLYTIHNPKWSYVSKIIPTLWLDSFVIRNVDYVITLTNHIKSNLDTLFPDVYKFVQIYNGVDTCVYFKDNKKIKQRGALLNVGSICPRKNQLNLIKDLSDYLLNTNDSKLIILGKIVDQDYFSNIISFINENNLYEKVIYGGEVEPGEKLSNLYNKSSVYVSSSKAEAFSLVVIEALACGLPVVLSSDFKSSLGDFYNKLSFLTINDNLVEPLTQINIIDNDQYDKLSNSASQFCISNFSWDKIALDHINIILQNKHANK